MSSKEFCFSFFFKQGVLLLSSLSFVGFLTSCLQKHNFRIFRQALFKQRQGLWVAICLTGYTNGHGVYNLFIALQETFKYHALEYMRRLGHINNDTNISFRFDWTSQITSPDLGIFKTIADTTYYKLAQSVEFLTTDGSSCLFQFSNSKNLLFMRYMIGPLIVW
jgi:hypothetical protein